MTTSSVDNKVVVRIYDEDYPITGAGDPKHISKIANLVDSRMKEIADGGRVKSRDKVAILAALSIASELVESRDALDETGGSVDNRVSGIITQLEEALADQS
ncbi:MAG: cell division protein ZapA [candidate division Zixibacteria bacterium]|nr:cell division protein ZapA [candidate division Zixibacteria bacterium]